MDREQTNPLIIPEFDDTSVKIGVIPWSFGVEGQTLISATPFLDLRQRFLSSQKLHRKTNWSVHRGKGRKEKNVIQSILIGIENLI